MGTLVGLQYSCVWTVLCGALSEENDTLLAT
jgi:hypothetical protein